MLQRLLMILAVTFLLNGCATTPDAERVMPAVKYQKDVGFQSSKTALLLWQSGKQFSSVAHDDTAPNDPLAAVISAGIDTYLRKTRPGQFTYGYGSPQQAVFMTSLRDILQQQHTFKKVDFIAKKSPLKPGQVLVTLDFQRTKVDDHTSKISLKTQMTIDDSHGHTFKQNYFVYSRQPDSVFKNKNFVEQQTDVSQQLMDHVVHGLKQWHKQYS